MSKTIHIITKSETFKVDDLNRISRPTINLQGSSNWTLRGAVEFKFGHVYKTYTPEDIRAERVPWKYKNGKQRCYVMDNDHGHQRMWMSPGLLDVMVTEEK